MASDVAPGELKVIRSNTADRGDTPWHRKHGCRFYAEVTYTWRARYSFVTETVTAFGSTPEEALANCEVELVRSRMADDREF